MKKITLTDEQYNKLIEELESLQGYHWSDDSIHADNCGSVSLPIITAATEDVDEKKLERQVKVLGCMHHAWVCDGSRLPGGISYGEVDEILKNLGLSTGHDSAVESHYYGDDRYHGDAIT